MIRLTLPLIAVKAVAGVIASKTPASGNSGGRNQFADMI
jgi:hypothetical protein